MLDHPTLTIALLQMERMMDHQMELQKVHSRKQYQQESLMASSDPDVNKIHLQSGLCLKLTPVINLTKFSSHHRQSLGSRSLRKPEEFYPPTLR